MDVVFHEDKMYFSKPECQREFQKEIQTLNHDDNCNENEINVDIKGATLDSSHEKYTQNGELDEDT